MPEQIPGAVFANMRGKDACLRLPRMPTYELSTRSRSWSPFTPQVTHHDEIMTPWTSRHLLWHLLLPISLPSALTQLPY